MRRVVAGLVLAALLGGCASTGGPDGPYTTPTEASRSTAEAERLNRQAADMLSTHPAKAEELLRAALTADLFFGPAHNNLGVVYLKQKKLYEAANEFEWARKLMPGHPDPRVNLALALETAGRTGEALASYSSALEVWPNYLPALEGIASLTLRAGDRRDPRLAAWLSEISLRGEPAWSSWAHARGLALSAGDGDPASRD